MKDMKFAKGKSAQINSQDLLHCPAAVDHEEHEGHEVDQDWGFKPATRVLFIVLAHGIARIFMTFMVGSRLRLQLVSPSITSCSSW
jgi:hypothetical protein